MKVFISLVFPLFRHGLTLNSLTFNKVPMFSWGKKFQIFLKVKIIHVCRDWKSGLASWIRAALFYKCRMKIIIFKLLKAECFLWCVQGAGAAIYVWTGWKTRRPYTRTNWHHDGRTGRRPVTPPPVLQQTGLSLKIRDDLPWPADLRGCSLRTEQLWKGK